MVARNHPTIRDVATRAGVSKSLVSLALQNSPRVATASREAVLAAAAELGYRPNAAARALVAHRTRTIGVFVLDLRNPIYIDILEGLQAEARRHGYQTILVVGSEDRVAERAELEKLMEFRVEGFITLGHRLPEGSARGRDNLIAISNDDVAGGSLAVDHLVSYGHSRISHVTGGNNSVARRRRMGYERAMTDHGLAANIACFDGEFTDEGGYRGTMRALAASTRPTALFVANDYAAIGAIAAAADTGLRVAEDLSIVGYDGTSLAGLRSIGLTTVAQPLHEMGVKAAGRLCSQLDSNSEGSPKLTKLSPLLVVRGTTAPLPTGRTSRSMAKVR
jgi:DNA-binding LacI/PurR family transcriptional regulator